MTYNFKQPGDNITIPAPTGGVISGRAYAVGSLIGVATATAAVGVSVAMATRGIFGLAKKTGEVWAVGDPVYWDKTAAKCTKTLPSTEQFTLGYATAAALTGDTTGDVKINP